jgi:urease accessory protein
MTHTIKILIGAAAVTLLSVPALAHPGLMNHGDFAGGFAHPFSGWDHLLAMIALGLWLGLAKTAKPAVAITTFAGALMAGYLLGVTGFHVPFVESGILASVLIFGLLTATTARLPAAIAAPVIAVFTVFHGHAHGTEAPAGAASLYAAGFIVASVAIVAAAYGAVYLLRRRTVFARVAGGVIAATGVILGVVA